MPLNNVFKAKSHRYAHTRRGAGKDTCGDCKQGKAGITILMPKMCNSKQKERNLSMYAVHTPN